VRAGSNGIFSPIGIDFINPPLQYLSMRINDRTNKYIEVNMMQSLQTVYDNLESIDRVDAITSAAYRQSAQEVLADPEISLEWRKAISDRLNQVNHELTVHAHVDDDSY
jgi:hypothetical protein